jgi:hypothetical protein
MVVVKLEYPMKKKRSRHESSLSSARHFLWTQMSIRIFKKNSEKFLDLRVV